MHSPFSEFTETAKQQHSPEFETIPGNPFTELADSNTGMRRAELTPVPNYENNEEENDSLSAAYFTDDEEPGELNEDFLHNKLPATKNQHNMYQLYETGEVSASQLLKETDLQRGDIILSTETDSYISAGIRYLSGKSLSSHSMIYLGKGFVTEAVAQGVITHPLSESIASAKYVMVLRYNGLTEAQKNTIAKFAWEQSQYGLKKSYDYRGAITTGIAKQIGVKTPQGDSTKFYCSELVLAAYRKAGADLDNAGNTQALPADLERNPRLTFIGFLKTSAAASEYFAAEQNFYEEGFEPQNENSGHLSPELNEATASIARGNLEAYYDSNESVARVNENIYSNFSYEDIFNGFENFAPDADPILFYEDVRVRSGETLIGLIAEYGFDPDNWREVWNDPQNAGLVAKRKLSTRLREGDILQIPIKWRIINSSLTASDTTFSMEAERSGREGLRLDWVQTVYGGNQPNFPVRPFPSFSVDLPTEDDNPFYWTQKEYDHLVPGSIVRTKISDTPNRPTPSVAMGDTTWRAVTSLCINTHKRISIWNTFVWGINFKTNGVNDAVNIRPATADEIAGHLNLLRRKGGKSGRSYTALGWTFRSKNP